MVIVFTLHASVLFTSGWDHKRLPSQEVWEALWPHCQCARLRVERSGFEGQGNCVAFLGKTLDSHSASLHPGQKWVPMNLMVVQHTIQGQWKYSYRPSCHRNQPDGPLGLFANLTFSQEVSKQGRCQSAEACFTVELVHGFLCKVMTVKRCEFKTRNGKMVLQIRVNVSKIWVSLRVYPRNYEELTTVKQGILWVT